MPKIVAEVFVASNDRDGKVRIYTIHELDNGHYRHTITVQGGRSLYMDMPFDIELIRHERLVRHMQSIDHALGDHFGRPWRIEYDDAEGVTRVDRTYESREHAEHALPIRQAENPAVMLHIRKHVEFDAES